jgi:hypothetical protein
MRVRETKRATPGILVAPNLTVEAVMPELMEHGLHRFGGFSPIFFAFICVDLSNPSHPCSIDSPFGKSLLIFGLHG